MSVLGNGESEAVPFNTQSESGVIITVDVHAPFGKMARVLILKQRGVLYGLSYVARSIP